MSWAIWLTGLPGSGKTALARAAAAEIRARDLRVTVLELDEVRRVLTPVPTYAEAEREIVYRALVWIARALVEAGIPVIVDATAHRRAWRDLARASIDRFAEVQLHCPLPICRERERSRTGSHAPRGIYDRAGRPGATVPGVDVAYEPALHPELQIDTAAEDIPSAARKIADLAQGLAPVGAEGAPAAATQCRGWAIWLTGLPGSGKTTLASRVAGALAGRGVAVRVLEPGTLRRLAFGARPGPLQGEEILHRALACAARLLTDAGVCVVVDATAPRRAWREVARRMIDHFAEVQLVCPREVCLARERAARWALATGRGAGAGGPEAGDILDLILSYEPSLRPDLTVDTQALTVWTAAEEVLWLVHRLERAALETARRRG